VLVLRFDVKAPIIIAATAILSGTAGAMPADVPPRSEGGQALVVPQEHLAAGEVYYVQPAMGTQLIWHSDAPLMRVVAVCNRVVGYVVTPFDIEEGQAPLLAGAFRIPVASFSAGSERYNQEFHGPRALDAAEYPEITLRITGVTDAQLTDGEKGRKTYTLKAAGELKIKDKTIAVEMPMRLTLAPFTWQTTQLGMGDALILRGKFEVPTADLGLAPSQPTASDYTAEAANFDLHLLCNTMSPERNLFPDITHEQFCKQLRFLTLVRDFDDPEKGYEFGRTFMREMWDDAQGLNRLASATLTEEGIQTRDLGFALKAAQRANELTEFQDPELLHTLAQVHLERADLESALKYARQAVESLEGAAPLVAAEVRATLQRCEAQAKNNRE
jgi:polyisoprenoid-binding protein YceI